MGLLPSLWYQLLVKNTAEVITPTATSCILSINTMIVDTYTVTVAIFKEHIGFGSTGAPVKSRSLSMLVAGYLRISSKLKRLHLLHMLYQLAQPSFSTTVFALRAFKVCVENR